MRQFVTVIFVMLIGISGCSKDTGDTNPTGADNNAPIIERMSSIVSWVGSNIRAQITCDASDPDGGSLTYVWDANIGVISGTGKTIYWTAPYPGGPYRITVIVSDGFETAIDSVGFPEAAPPDNWGR